MKKSAQASLANCHLWDRAEQVPSPWWASSARQTTRRRCRQRGLLRYRTLPPGRHRTAQVVQTQMRRPALSARADVAAAEQRHGSTRPLRPQYGVLDARRRFRHVCEIVLHLDDRSAVACRRSGMGTTSRRPGGALVVRRLLRLGMPRPSPAPCAGGWLTSQGRRRPPCLRVERCLPACASSGACLPALCSASHVASPRRPEARDRRTSDCCGIVDASCRMSADAPNTSGRTPCTGTDCRLMQRTRSSHVLHSTRTSRVANDLSRLLVLHASSPWSSSTGATGKHGRLRP
ncbi:hypothetical protein PBRA_009085 [Plasmodiophora brassicae]|uniref:Uncharacterized protein n=1 Tax=Plasmodiophora brassicae TaxID=37360 RepID=A0A0G4J5D0_PLABS|nr:hypothetical protein PBRA_009085 [Plasmodiophora brassicae]